MRGCNCVVGRRSSAQGLLPIQKLPSYFNSCVMGFFVTGKCYHSVAQRHGLLFKEKPESLPAAIPLKQGVKSNEKLLCA